MHTNQFLDRTAYHMLQIEKVWREHRASSQQKAQYIHPPILLLKGGSACFITKDTSLWWLSNVPLCVCCSEGCVQE